MCGNMLSVQPTKAPWAHARASPSPSRGHWAGPWTLQGLEVGAQWAVPSPLAQTLTLFTLFPATGTSAGHASLVPQHLHGRAIEGTQLTRKRACGLLGCGPSGPPPNAVKNTAPTQAAFTALSVPRAMGQSWQKERGRGAGTGWGEGWLVTMPETGTFSFSPKGSPGCRWDEISGHVGMDTDPLGPENSQDIPA